MITQRPADLLEPEIEKARESVSEWTDNIEDILTAAIYPETGLDFVRRKYASAPAVGKTA